MLKLYDYLQTYIEQRENHQWFFEPSLPYFVSEVLETLDILDVNEIEVSLKRTFEACKILHIPLSRNFKRVYLFDGNNLFADWKVSALAHYLIVINCNPSNEKVAKAQLYFAMNNSIQNKYGNIY